MVEDIEYYMSLSYAVEVVPDAYTDGSLCYGARHPELPGCVSHGDTADEAEANLAEARQLYIATLLKKGLSVPRPIQTSSTTGVEKPQRVIWEILAPGPRETPSNPSKPVEFTRAEFAPL